jgi:hypothetical protein
VSAGVPALTSFSHEHVSCAEVNPGDGACGNVQLWS